MLVLCCGELVAGGLERERSVGVMVNLVAGC